MFKSKKINKRFLCALLALILSMAWTGSPHSKTNASGSTQYKIGAGIHDVTGPCAELIMMGYAKPDQSAEGIHLRLRSRAFIVEEKSTGKRVVFVSADLGQIFQSVKLKVIEKLKKNGYENFYNESNVMLSATHTHSGVGGYSYYTLYNISILGFNEQNFNCIVDGIYQSIVKAHNNLEDGYIEINRGTLKGNTANRSKTAYNNNPVDERAQYEDEVDRDMTVLNFKSADGRLIGVINWFPIHGVSMNHHNKLISGDNKGYASYLFEKEMGTNYNSNKTFVSAFAQCNCGDVSPNINGGESGFYGLNDVKNTEYAGRMQYEKCKELSTNAYENISGSIDYRHKYIDFSNISISPEYADGQTRQTYPAALGYSFAAGADDGPSDAPMFKEQMTADNYPIDYAGNYALIDAAQRLIRYVPFFNSVIGINYPELWEMHYPKPILFATSQGKPYPWSPEVLPLQIIRIGQLAIAGVPAEFTSMSGRRVKKIIKETLDSDGSNNTVVIAGLSNAYAGYVATPEEYDIQEYEGASTHFGKWTLDAYKQELDSLAHSLADGTSVEPGPIPRDLSNAQATLQTGVVLDNVPASKNFGDIVSDVNPSYKTGDTVNVTFWSGHPKNDLKTQSTFLMIQKKIGDNWVTVANDWDWETIFRWKHIDPVLGSSQVTITWNIPKDAQSGIYRIVHNGEYKNGWNGKIYPYTGISSTFAVE